MPLQYERFKAERAQPFFDLLALAEPVPGGRVVDLGCGTGELTAHLPAYFEAASTLGIDNSPAMLTGAAAFAGDALAFQEADIAAFGPSSPGEYDVVLANAALQWVPEHEHVLAAWTGALRPGGQLAVQVPANADHPSHLVAAAVADEPPFRDALGHTPPPDPVAENVLKPERYAELLDRLGFAEQHVRLQVYGHHLASTAEVVEWTKGTSLIRFRSVLSPELFDTFVDRYRVQLLDVLGEQRSLFLRLQANPHLGAASRPPVGRRGRYGANHEHARRAAGTVRPAHERGGADAVRPGHAIPRRRGRADAGGVLRTRGDSPGSMGLHAGSARAARRREGEGEGGWSVELLPARLRGRRALESRLRVHRSRVGQVPARARSRLNCSAPDTGNMEVLERVGTPEQKKEWLEPLLAGEIRSAYTMTEPDLASSDAKNVSLSAVRDGDEYVLNGEKYYISGAGDPRCKIMIVMCKTNPDASAHKQQSQILVPMDTPGMEILGPMHVFGHDDAPHGHMHLRFTDVRVPETNMLLGEGRGFEISQVRLGPGRIHHCMRAIGQGEKALELMIRRGKFREAFGKPILSLGKNMELVARARIELDACRLMVLKAARAMDVLGNAEARVYVSAVKAMVPEKVCQIIDQAIQIHGATGVSQWTPLASMYTSQRTLRLADGPDEVHHFVVARHEAGRYSEPAPARSDVGADG